MGLGHQSYLVFFFFFFNLVLLEGDLSYFAIPHEGSCNPVYTFSRPDPNDEVWREKSDFLPYFPLEEMVGRISLLNSTHVPPYPQSHFSYPPPLLIGVINDCDLLSRPGREREGPLRFRGLSIQSLGCTQVQP